eukprot:TRINITY_DN23880_c0_g1_i1.p1 TRINITY_DN23880_c0_g1~~TRINITY_DN23880_c0_g1_i1.p1  ORF type:complete len:552 (+),score=43.17 TRINITY_DN23880_c0_g1_i1:82-1656(+)
MAQAGGANIMFSGGLKQTAGRRPVAPLQRVSPDHPPAGRQQVPAPLQSSASRPSGELMIEENYRSSDRRGPPRSSQMSMPAPSAPPAPPDRPDSANSDAEMSPELVRALTRGTVLAAPAATKLTPGRTAARAAVLGAAPLQHGVRPSAAPRASATHRPSAQSRPSAVGPPAGRAGLRTDKRAQRQDRLDAWLRNKVVVEHKWDFCLKLPVPIGLMPEGDHFFPFGGDASAVPPKPDPWLLNLSVSEHYVGVYLHANIVRRATCRFKIGTYERKLVDTGHTISPDPDSGWGVMLPLKEVQTEQRVLVSPKELLPEQQAHSEEAQTDKGWAKMLSGLGGTRDKHSGWFETIKEQVEQDEPEGTTAPEPAPAPAEDGDTDRDAGGRFVTAAAAGKMNQHTKAEVRKYSRDLRRFSARSAADARAEEAAGLGDFLLACQDLADTAMSSCDAGSPASPNLGDDLGRSTASASANQRPGTPASAEPPGGVSSPLGVGGHAPPRSPRSPRTPGTPPLSARRPGQTEGRTAH